MWLDLSNEIERRAHLAHTEGGGVTEVNNKEFESLPHDLFV